MSPIAGLRHFRNDVMSGSMHALRTWQHSLQPAARIPGPVSADGGEETPRDTWHRGFYSRYTWPQVWTGDH